MHINQLKEENHVIEHDKVCNKELEILVFPIFLDKRFGRTRYYMYFCTKFHI